MSYHGPNLDVDKIKVKRLIVKEKLEFAPVVHAINAGALPLTSPTIILTSAGAETRTLANGYEGQTITLVAKTAVGAIVITPANLAGALTTLTLAAANDTATMTFHGGTWYPVSSYGTAAFA